MMQKTIGGDRLGSGKKMTTSLRNYERSTHDLSKVVRTTMTSGALTPLYVEPVLKGDTWQFDISSLVRTHPTNGPVFGTWKMQIDVFTADTRLYNKQLHNNQTGIGLKMNQVLFPLTRLKAPNLDASQSGDINQQQISSSSLLAYLGQRGLGKLEVANGEGYVEILRNAMPLMAYWDIYKEYYSNKQEERGFAIGATPNITTKEIVEAYIPGSDSGGTTIPKQWISNMPDEQAAVSPNLFAAEVQQGGTVVIEGSGLSVDNILVRGRLNTDPGTAIQEFTITAALGGTVTTTTDGITITNVDRYFQFVGSLAGSDDEFKSRWAIRLENANREIDTNLEVIDFPLTNIDDMRELVFSQPKTSPLIIGYEGEELRGLPYDLTTGITPVTTEEGEKEILNSYFTLSGLGLKTYQSDRFNNWLATEWINAINDISSVSTTGGSFTMDALNLAQKVYDLSNRIAVSGNTYQDWYEAVYGDEVRGAPEMPVYRGGMSAEITFDEVISSSEATTAEGWAQPLGTLGGRGIEKMKQGGKIEFKVEEHGYVIVICSLTPRIDYSQGNKWWTRGLMTMDDYHKPQLDGIGFQELPTDEMAAFDTIVREDGTETFKSAGKQPAWIHYMTNWNEVYGNFAIPTAEQWMVLSRRYQHDENGNIEDLTTYIDPTHYNYPFAYLELKSMPFWVQVGFDVTTRRKMSACIIPNL